jgi:hypothetical protein
MNIAPRVRAAACSVLFPMVASAQPHFAEMLINPPGGDQGYESVELLGEPDLPLIDHWFIVIAGNGPQAGVIAQLVDLSAATLGSDGVLLIRDDPSVTTLPVLSPTTSLLAHDFTPDLQNGTATYVLATGTPWFSVGFDLDFDNNGTIDFPLSMTVVDAVSYSDGGTADREYARELGGTQLGTLTGLNGVFTPDALYRLLTADGEVLAWAGGDTQGPVGGPWTWTEGQTFGFENACVTTPSLHTLDLGNPNWRFLPYADCDGSTGPGVLDIFDFLCFANAFIAGESYACDCDNSTGPEGCDIFDFICFQRAFVTGCK